MILFCEDIGVSRGQIDELLQRYEIELCPVYSVGEVDREKVKVIVVVNKRLDEGFLGGFPNLEMVAVSFTGYDHVCREYCLKNNIAVYNAAGYSTDPVAELAVGLAQAVLRKVAQLSMGMKDGKWEPFVGRELAGKTVGVVGTGAIGVRVAEIFKAYNCQIVGHSRSRSQQFCAVGEYVSWEELFGVSDIITLHLPLNESTRGIVALREFELMKESAIIVNTARGPVICRDSLVRALSGNMIYGAGLDVYEVEPPNDTELQNLANAVLTPHIAFRTVEALERKADITIENIMRFFSGNGLNRVI